MNNKYKITPGFLKLSNRVIEVYLWLIIALVVAFRPIFFLVRNSYYISGTRFLLDYYTEILFAFIVFLFPFLFKLIYSEFPLEYLRHKKRISMKIESADNNDIDSEINLAKNTVNSRNLEEAISVNKEIHLLEINLSKSQHIADKIFSRSGAYLLIGCLIAFAGVLFFYFQTLNAHNLLIQYHTFNISTVLLEYLPRVGTLIFVEAIAFFFLKQYKVTMDEFRYYEAIKRQRENQLTTLKFMYEFQDKPELFDKLITAISFNENPNKLTKDETTTMIEAGKLSSNDIDIFEKFLEILKLTKK